MGRLAHVIARSTIVATALAATLVGCGGDGATGSCADLAGTWTITKHCDPGTVGKTVTFQQSGCEITGSFETATFHGTLASDGTFNLTVTAGATTLDCSGSASRNSANETCTDVAAPGDKCDVTFTR